MGLRVGAGSGGACGRMVMDGVYDGGVVDEQRLVRCGCESGLVGQEDEGEQGRSGMGGLRWRG